MIREKIEELLKKALEDAGIKEEKIELSHPANSDHGDYATSVALKYSKALKKSPLDLAKEISQKIPKTVTIEKTEVIAPGFINFFISKDLLIEEAKKIAEKKENYGKKTQGDFKVLLEFGQPNTHKTPHIGHLFSYIYGESLARIFEYQGNKVYRANYQGDIGLHVAKCLYIVQKKQTQIKNLKTLNEKVEFLQKCYVEGSKLYESDKKAEAEIDKLNQKIYSNDSSIKKMWEETRNWSLEFYQDFEKKLGITYDKYYFESETAAVGKKIVEENTPKVFAKSEGAIVYRGEKAGLHTRVFINKFGNPTYETKDVGLISLKMKDFPFNLSIVTTAHEQSEYWKVIIKVSEELFPKLKNKLLHLGYGMINLTTGKMSSRTGEILEAFSLVDEIQKHIKQEYKTTGDLAEKIGLAAIKYSFLRSDIFKNISFDVEKSVAKEGDSGPYLLYTYVRVQGILNQVQNTKYEIRNTKISPEEENLLRTLYQFPEIVEKATKVYSPHLIVNYLFDLAQKFNLFYQKNPVLKAGEAKKALRLLLTSATGQIIKNGLWLLGIEVVEKM